MWMGHGGYAATVADQGQFKRRGRGNTVHVKEPKCSVGLQCVPGCAYSGRYFHHGDANKYFACSLVPWPINNPHQLSWQLAPHFCPSLPARSPERLGLRHLGDKLPISPVGHLWGWALLQSSSSTWRKERRGKLEEQKSTEIKKPFKVINTVCCKYYWKYLTILIHI